MKIKSIKHLTFHRNGSGAGEPFYSALITTKKPPTMKQLIKSIKAWFDLTYFDAYNF